MTHQSHYQLRGSNGQFLPEGRDFRLSIRVTRSELALAHIMARRAGKPLTQYITALVQADSEGVKVGQPPQAHYARELRQAIATFNERR